MSTFGTLFRVTTFGESHCRGVGAVVDGCPPGLPLTEEDIQPQLTRRRPGQSVLTTPRNETDCVSILSGTEHGRTLGTPIGLFVPNRDVRPKDYSEMSRVPRPGHADYTYQIKYGIRATSGGGRSSARETVGRVAAGAVAEQFLRHAFGTQITCWVSAVGSVQLPDAAVADAGGAWTREAVDGNSRLLVLRDPARAGPAAPTRSSGDSTSAAAPDDAAGDAASAYDAWFLEHTGWLGGERTAAASSLPAYLHCPQAGTDAALCDVYAADGTLLRSPAGQELARWWSGDVALVRCPHTPTACQMATAIRHVKHDRDSVGAGRAATVLASFLPLCATGAHPSPVSQAAC